MSDNTNSDLAAVQADLAALKRDVRDLLIHTRSAATATSAEAIESADASIRSVLRSIADEGERSMKVVGQKVEDQPLTALLIAFGVGYLGGRIVTR